MDESSESEAVDSPGFDGPAPPTDFPPALATSLADASVHDLRETIIYAQELLQHHQKRIERIEPGPGEEIVEITERPGYTVVVKRQPCGNDCEGCPHGPYVYHVTRERKPNGETALNWTLIGRRATEAGGSS